jgi:alkylated DNA repair dioxygenase AlkB
VAPDIPGLRYRPNYLDAATHDEILRLVAAEPWQDVNAHRRIQFHGQRYDYLSRSMKPAAPLPDWAARIAEALYRDDLMLGVADQLLVSEYAPGQGIPPHLDADVFDDAIVSISLGSACVMEFVDTKSDQTEALLLEPMSALSMAGDARHRWKHAIPERTADEWMGETIARGRRVSLTFRNVVQ